MKKVLLLLAKGFEMIEASVFIDVIGWNSSFGDASVSLVICGSRPEVESTFSVGVKTGILIGDVRVDEYDALAIPGGFGTYGYYEEAHSAAFQQLIRDFHDKNKLIASICVGAIPLAQSGILKGKKATTYNLNEKKTQHQLASLGVEVVNRPVVIDDNIITSWNPSTAFDVAFTMLERLTSKDNARYIRQQMGFYSK